MHREAALGQADAGLAGVRAVVRYTHTPPVPALSPRQPGVWKALAGQDGALAAKEERT